MQARLFAWLLVVALAAYSVFSFVYEFWPVEESLPVQQDEFASAPPEAYLHVHPHLRIVVFDLERSIPANIGITAGNNVDNEVSGVAASPVHTHDRSGTLHVETRFPSQPPTLGYFFNRVWGKRLTKECVFDYCARTGYFLRMFVNGAEEKALDGFELRGDDEIVLVFGED